MTLEDPAADAEKELFAVMDNRQSDERERTSEGDGVESSSPTSGSARPYGVEKPRYRSAAPNNKQSRQARATSITKTAADARKTLLRLHNRVAAHQESHARDGSRWGNPSRIEVADQLGAAISRYPDELLDLSAREREAELRAAYQDPVTREVSLPAYTTSFETCQLTNFEQPQPVIWIPQDPAGISEDSIRQASKYGRHLQYSNEGAYLTKKNKCEVTQPAPDVRSDWLLDWVL